MDVEKLIGEVAARNGIRIEPDDPAFALVTLNQLVLEQTVQDLVVQIRAATAEFESAADRVQKRAGTILAREVTKRSTQSERDAICRRSAIWFGVGALFGAVLLAVGAWLEALVWGR
jgi:hypothetical protein